MAAVELAGGVIPPVPGPELVPMDGLAVVEHMLTVCELTGTQRTAVMDVILLLSLLSISAI
jgi:hypothetical protein